MMFGRGVSNFATAKGKPRQPRPRSSLALMMVGRLSPSGEMSELVLAFSLLSQGSCIFSSAVLLSAVVRRVDGDLDTKEIGMELPMRVV